MAFPRQLRPLRGFGRVLLGVKLSFAVAVSRLSLMTHRWVLRLSHAERALCFQHADVTLPMHFQTAKENQNEHDP
ncbi:MAG: hypothetical protein JWN34_2298 [Bryobacterales bacterium]|nr:hypothetical protein [Bryobacterales bacterium]